MKLTELLIKELSTIENIRIITPEEKGSIVSFNIIGKDIRQIGEKLQNLRRPIELNVRQNMLRVSLHVYNTEADVNHIVSSLEQVLSS